MTSLLNKKPKLNFHPPPHCPTTNGFETHFFRSRLGTWNLCTHATHVHNFLRNKSLPRRRRRIGERGKQFLLLLFLLRRRKRPLSPPQSSITFFPLPFSPNGVYLFFPTKCTRPPRDPISLCDQHQIFALHAYKGRAWILNEAPSSSSIPAMIPAVYLPASLSLNVEYSVWGGVKGGLWGAPVSPLFPPPVSQAMFSHTGWFKNSLR